MIPQKETSLLQKQLLGNIILRHDFFFFCFSKRTCGQLNFFVSFKVFLNKNKFVRNGLSNGYFY